MTEVLKEQIILTLLCVMLGCGVGFVFVCIWEWVEEKWLKFRMEKDLKKRGLIK